MTSLTAFKAPKPGKALRVHRLLDPRFRVAPALIVVFLLSGTLVLTGCDAIYRLLQKEGAEEKDLLGNVVPMEYNERVAEAQRLLKLLGYKIGRADGILGANTRQAIGEFQKDQSVKVTRFIDYKTWERLNQFERYGLVINGELNIKAVQLALKEAGVNPGAADGALGAKTQKAIVDFQKREKLKPDGKIGINTLQALEKYLAAAHP